MGTFTGERAVIKPLPKPARVEKWQRWSDRYDTERVVTDVSDIRAIMKDVDGKLVGIPPMGMMDHWTFLGYAKPDKVEVGQRWRTDMGGVPFVVNSKSFIDKHWDVKSDLLDAEGYFLTDAEILKCEYLGMAESGETISAAATRVAKATGQSVQSVVDAMESIQQAYATTSYGRPTPGTQHVIGPPVRDSKAEARYANEEAAKRLIANPPEWAYPKAWMCAVLWCMEQHGDRSALLDSLDEGAAWMFIGLYQRLRGEGMTHEAALDKATKREVPIARDVVNAYARGMERSSLMTRPGVKGGISTCDLGGEYE